MDFEWDGKKARSNLNKHHVSFAEAITVFSDPLALIIDDSRHAVDEDRFIIMGESEQGRLLTIAFTERGDNIRIISARLASRPERRDYERNR